MSRPGKRTGPVTDGVGASVIHDSARKHVSGEAIYVDDMPMLPGTLHAAIVKSARPHARILGIDPAPALALPGVHGVVTAADIPGVNDIAPIFQGEPCLADEVAEYAGQPLAAVAADTLELAWEAAALVAVDYEDLPPVLEIEEALNNKSFVSPPQIMKSGDAAKALRAAKNRLKGRLTSGGQDHFYLEGQVAMAVPQEDRDMLVYSSTQHPTEVQHGVAHVLGLENKDVTVEIRRMGGGFGGKESHPTIIAGIAALLADRIGRPVKLRLNRDDDMIITGKRHDFLIDYEVGYDDDGRIQALDMTYAARAGNVADLSPPVVTRALCHADNAYYIPHAHLRGYACKTNTVSNTAFRGFGGPQGMLGIEAVIEEIAVATGKTPEAVRRVNYYGVDDRNETPYGQTVEDNIIVDLVDQLEAEADLAGRRAEIRAFNAESPIIKKGIALMPVKFGISFNLPALNQAGALVHVYTDGSVHLNHGGTEMGQGLFVKVAQVVAQTFGIGLDQVKISATRTDKVPNTSATAASTGSDVNGMAAQAAALQIKARMTAFAAKHFSVPDEDIRFADGQVSLGEKTLTFGELAQLVWRERISLSATGYYKTPKIHWNLKTLQGRPFYYFAYGACVSEVAIDTLTGETRVLRADIIHDVGNSLNPAIDIGQIEGGYVQGLGWMTMEELWWNGEGTLMTHAPSTYKIPGSRDVPPVFNVHILKDSPNREETVYRSKAVGEPPLMLAISVWLAVRDAVASLADHRISVRLDPPATAETVLNAVEDIMARAAKRAAE